MWYEIDPVDRVSAVCPQWNEEAAQNGAMGLMAEKVIGRKIWGFLDGVAPFQHYAAIFEMVRQNGFSASYTFRSDAPIRQSTVELTISPLSKQALRLTTRVLRKRFVPYSPLWDHTKPRNSDVIKACSWCKALNLGQKWMTLKQAELRRADLRSFCPPQVSHDVCPECDQHLAQSRRRAAA